MKKIMMGMFAFILLAAGGVYYHFHATAQARTLHVGDKAPLFKAPAALAGKQMPFALSEALSEGPVVLYFFPKAFTKGCTLESNQFAEATPEFEAAGARIIGLSGDDIETLAEFSTLECRDKFAVARANAQILDDYGVRFAPGVGLSSRTSYVIAPDRQVIFVHNDSDYRDHVRLTLQAVKEYAAKQPKDS